MITGNSVLWAGSVYTILAEYDSEYIYLDTGNGTAQLVHVSECELMQ